MALLFLRTLTALLGNAALRAVLGAAALLLLGVRPEASALHGRPRAAAREAPEGLVSLRHSAAEEAEREDGGGKARHPSRIRAGTHTHTDTQRGAGREGCSGRE